MDFYWFFVIFRGLPQFIGNENILTCKRVLRTHAWLNLRGKHSRKKFHIATGYESLFLHAFLYICTHSLSNSWSQLISLSLNKIKRDWHKDGDTLPIYQSEITVIDCREVPMCRKEKRESKRSEMQHSRPHACVCVDACKRAY